MHEMQTIVSDVRGVCLSRGFTSVGFTVWGSFGAAVVKSLWPSVTIQLVLYFCLLRSKRKDRESGVSRGIDFQNVSNIVSFDFPPDVNSYIHRVGRLVLIIP